jgi:hypothetical protein
VAEVRPAAVFSASVVAGFVGVSALTGADCKTPPSAPSQPLSADQVTDILVDAGCLAPGSSDAVAAQLATGHSPWLACVFEGGSISDCNAPCERAGLVRKP